MPSRRSSSHLDSGALPSTIWYWRTSHGRYRSLKATFWTVKDVTRFKPWSARLLERYHGRACSQAVEIVGPCLHHLPPLVEPLGAVVGGAHMVPFGMGKLQLDDIGRKALLVQERRG